MDGTAEAGETAFKTPDRTTISIVTPCFNEEQSLPLLYQRLCDTLDGLGMRWQWILIDDRSKDDTWAVISRLAAADPRVRGVRFSRNFGSHTAIVCGLELAEGDCVAVLAGDLQDPPEIIPDLLERWRAGSHIVWAVRRARHGERRSNVLFARLYYWLMRHVAGLTEMPATGADFFLIDRSVVDAVRRFGEQNTSLFALLTWIGFRHAQVPYDKQARAHGRSGWTLSKKLKLAVDSLAAFSFSPIRTMSWIGVLTALIGFVYAAVVVVNAMLGVPAEGWSSLMVAVLVIGGLQMLMLGVLGEYLWRSLDESRRRPRYLIERSTGRGLAADSRRQVPADAIVSD